MVKNQITTVGIDEAFRTEAVFDASDDVLLGYLKDLNTGAIPNDMVRHRETNRCITINTVINMRLIKRIERSNTIYTWVVIILAVLSVMLALLSVIASAIQIFVSLRP